MYRDSKLRSIGKALSWRITATLTTMILVYIFTGTIETALAIGGIEVFAKMAIYFLHERAWDKVHLGKKDLEPYVVWFTGLSGSGKSTLANEVMKKLKKRKYKMTYLDGDVIRAVLPNVGFSKEERDRHIQRVGFLASMLEKNGIVVIASFVSPYEESREFVRKLCNNFVLVHVSTPLEECEKRDVKGLYKKARAGEIKNFTGISDPYEDPKNPELKIDTTGKDLSKTADEVIAYLDKRF